MEKYILKVKSTENSGDMNVAIRANVGLKISSKTTFNGNDEKIVKIRKSLSMRTDPLAKILNSNTFQPLFIDTNGTSPLIGTSSNICDDENVQPQSNNEGVPNRFFNGMDNLTPPSAVGHISAINANPKTPQNHHVLARLQRDLESPSAAIRLRAMRALKSPGNGPYNHFDVPHEEQDIITEEERQELVPVTIQDVMKNVVVYVEARFGGDNRTASIKEAMAELGITVNDNFNKNTTHVIFSNGTQSTYNKAKQLNIPIVSILWIEACKKQLRLVDPSKYTIHNMDEYERPELYKKIKIRKFFKSESELKIKKKKITTPVMKFKPIKIPKKAQDNLTGMLNEFEMRQAAREFNMEDLFNDTPVTVTAVNSKRSLAFDAEATTTPKDTVSSQLHLTNTKPRDNNKSISSKELVKLQDSPTVFKTPLKRKTLLAQSVDGQTSNSIGRVTRRTSMLALNSPAVDITPTRISRPPAEPAEIIEISNSNNNQTNNNAEAMDISPNVGTTSPRIKSNRRTIFTSSAMDITEPKSSSTSTRKRNSIAPARYKDFIINTDEYFEKNSTNDSQSEKSDRRRTIFPSSNKPSASSTITTLNKADDAKTSVPNRRRTLHALNQKTVSETTLNEIHEEKESTSNVTSFAPQEASSPLVVSKDEGYNIGNIRRTLFKSTNATMSPLAITPNTKVDATKATSTKRRRTLLPPSGASSSLVKSTLKKAAESNGEDSLRRQAIITPSHAISTSSNTSTSTKPDEIPNRRRTCFATSHALSNHSTPPSTGVAQPNRDYLTPQSHTLFEEYSRKLSFSSTNKRETVRDISLHIIEQRLKNINEIARLNRSSSESDVNVANIEKRINESVARSSPQLPSTDKVDQVAPPPPKKRKLFDPAAYEQRVVMKTADESDGNNKATVASADNTAVASADNTQTRKTKIPSLATHDKRPKTPKTRRSIMDFKTQPPKPVKVYASIMKSNSPINYLAYSNMNQHQVSVINEAVNRMGKFEIEPNVTKKTTHLVIFDSKRTPKFLRAIIRGLWIVKYEWVTESLKAGHWLYEEPYENRSISDAVSTCRAEAQSFGPKYKIDLFGHIEPVYISTKCKCSDLKELYTMCAGEVTNSKSSAKYVIIDGKSSAKCVTTDKDKYKDDANQIFLRSDWILDSITNARCKGKAKYILKSMPAPMAGV